MARQTALSEHDKEYQLIKDAHSQQYPQMLSKFEGAIKLNANCAQIYEARAKEHLLAGKLELAASDCDTALKIDPDNEFAYLTRAQVRYFSDKYDAAIDDVNKYFDHDHSERYWGRYLGSLIQGASYYHLSKFSESIKILSKTLRGDVGEILPDSYYYRGLSHFALGNYSQALADLNVSIKKNKNIPEYYLARARVLAKLGKNLESANDRKAADKVPSSNKKRRYYFL